MKYIFTTLTACVDEQEAAKAFGYDQQLWDSGKIAKSANAWWRDLTAQLQQAAKDLGWNEKSWDKGKPEPASNSKKWAQLTTCGENPSLPHHSLTHSLAHPFACCH